MKKTVVPLSVLFLFFSFPSCHAPSDDHGAAFGDSSAAAAFVHVPEFRQQVKKEPVAEYKENLNDGLNKDWVFSVRLFETSKTLEYRVSMRYEELEGEDTLKLPDLGAAPRPVIQKGKEEHSCMIGFMDNDNQFREYKLVYEKGDQLGIKAVKHYAVTRGYRLVSE
jgi:hypothetical protein